MKLIDILPVFEARSNPELNPKNSTIDQLRKYKDDPNIFISFTRINKLGVNPGSRTGGTPLGIYFFPLKVVWDLYHIEEHNFLEFPSIVEGARFIQVAKWTGKQKFIYGLDTYTKQDLQQDIHKLSRVFDNEQMSKSSLESSKSDIHPFKQLYDGSKVLANKNPIEWNKILRDLGYVGFNDIGSGMIHIAEPVQAVFFSNNSFTHIDAFPIKLEVVLPDDVVDIDPRELTPLDMVRFAEKYRTRIKKFEPYILRTDDANVIRNYMRVTNSFKTRWREAEDILKRDAQSASWYSINYLHRRWYEAEEYIQSKSLVWDQYKKYWKILESE